MSGAHATHQPPPPPGDPHPGLILPGDAAEPRVQLQVLPGRELIEQGVELWAVAQALLHLEQLLEHAGDTAPSAPVTAVAPPTQTPALHTHNPPPFLLFSHSISISPSLSLHLISPDLSDSPGDF